MSHVGLHAGVDRKEAMCIEQEILFTASGPETWLLGRCPEVVSRAAGAGASR